MKKAAVLFMVCLFFLTGNQIVFAQEKAVFEVAGLGLISADETDEASLAKPLDRGEMADILARLLGIANVGVELRSSFSDVTPENKHYQSVAFLETMGLIYGDGNGLYRPNDIVSGMEAVKPLVSCLGYDFVAIRNGGYPDGYLKTATSLRLLSGTGLKEQVTRLDYIRMIYNALDLELLEPTTNNSGLGYQLTEGKTLRSVLETQGKTKVVSGSGVISSTYEAYLDRANSHLEKDELEIDGVTYHTGKVDAEQYFGMLVEYYAVYDTDSDEYTLTSVRPSAQNEVTDVAAADFLEASGGVFRYENSYGTKWVNYAAGARVIYNGRPLKSYRDSDIRADNGSFRLIDNNGDGSAEIILITDYKSGMLEKVKNDVLYFERGENAGSISSIAIDTENSDVRYCLRDGNGNRITPSELKPGSVISIAASQDGSRYELIASEGKAEGVISGMSDDDGFEIGGKWYKAEKGKQTEYSVNDDVTVYLNFEGYIVKMSSRSPNKRYGYVIATEQKGLGSPKVKMLMAGTLKAEEKIDDSDPDNPVTTRILRAGNSDVEVYYLAKRVTVDGVTYGSKEALTKLSCGLPLEYELDGDGNVRRVYYPEKSGIGEERYYNSYEKTFGRLGDSVFATNEETQVICVPINGATDRRDLLAKIEMNEDGQKYTISGYDVNENTGYADLVVLQAALSADAMGEINSENKVAVAEKAAWVIDENGEERLRIDFWSDGKKMSYYTSNVLPVSQADALRSGTVFKYVLTNADEIGKVEIWQQLSPEPPWYASGSQEVSMGLYGPIESIDFDELSYEKNRFVHKMTVRTGQDSFTTVDINVRNTPDIYLYRSAEKKISVIDPEEMLSGGMDRKVYGTIVSDNAVIFVVVE